jgi:hypothetical protein
MKRSRAGARGKYGGSVKRCDGGVIFLCPNPDVLHLQKLWVDFEASSYSTATIVASSPGVRSWELISRPWWTRHRFT